jgi:hypothetical protein
MKKFVIFSLIILFFIFLSGCELNIASEVYIRDLYDFANDKNIDSTMVKSVLKMEIISKDTFKENKDKITDIIKEYFDNVENVRYEENNLRSYYVADIEIPITKGLEIEDKILSFSFNGVSLFIRFNNFLFEELNSIILNNFYQTFDLKDFSIEIVLVNDLKKDVNVELQGVYVNSRPYPFLTRITMKNRDKLIIKFSDVLRDYMAQEGKTVFVNINW